MLTIGIITALKIVSDITASGLCGCISYMGHITGPRGEHVGLHQFEILQYKKYVGVKPQNFWPLC